MFLYAAPLYDDTALGIGMPHTIEVFHGLVHYNRDSNVCDTTGNSHLAGYALMAFIMAAYRGRI